MTYLLHVNSILTTTIRKVFKICCGKLKALFFAKVFNFQKVAVEFSKKLGEQNWKFCSRSQKQMPKISTRQHNFIGAARRNRELNLSAKHHQTIQDNPFRSVYEC